MATVQSRVLGLPEVPWIVLPHPIGGTPLASVLSKVDAVFEQIVARLTTPLPRTTAATQAARAARVEIACDDEWADLQREFVRRGWSDGLPIVPPTEARVRAMLRLAGRPATDVVALLPPAMGAMTVELIAINAVMAGCSPIHMPLLITAIEAIAQPPFNLHGIQVTTHCVSPLLIVSGPLAAAMNIRGGAGMFGPGPWSNGVVGRALRLLLLNAGGAKPVEIDKSTMGHPAKFSFVMAEDEAASPWSSLREDRGHSGEISTVTVVGAEGPHNINDHESTTAEGLLTMIASSMAQPGQNNVYYAAEPLLILSPEHAATLAEGGASKDSIRQYLFEQARIPLSRFSRENIERRMWRKFPDLYAGAGPDVGVRVAQCPQDIMLVVGGGPGKHSMYVPTFGGTRSVTLPITHPDGRPVLPGDLR